MGIFKLTNVFYGYRVVAALFVCSTFLSGCVFYTFSLFVNLLQADFGWGRGEIMVANTLMTLILGGTGPLIGKLLNQYGAKRVIAIGAVITALGFTSLTQMQELWQFYAGYAVIGVGAGAIGIIPATVVVSNWFQKRRGTAIGIMSMGIGAGGLILAPLFGGYFLPNFGWQISYLAFALLICIIIPLAIFVIRTKPSDMGLYPDGASAPEVAEETVKLPTETPGITLKTALTTSAFWLIAVSGMASGFSVNGILSNQVPHLEDVGFSLVTASTVVGASGLGSLFGKLLFGSMCDRIKPKFVWSIALVCQFSAIMILVNIDAESTRVVLWTYAVLMGLGFGGMIPVLSMLSSTTFGLSSYGVIFGMLNFSQCIGLATGSVFGGYMFDMMGTYNLAFTVYLVLYAVSIPAILLMRQPKFPQSTI
jgi:MFS family permease